MNRFDPAPEERGQPTSFEPGTYEDLFTVAYEDEALTWCLDGNEATTSGESPRCEAPPTEPVTTVKTIDYVYDPLYRLVEANYDTGEFFHYADDAVGNRQTQMMHLSTNTYTYDHANRLTAVVMGADSYTYTYNGLGDRLQQTVNGASEKYTLDLVAGLTQVLGDGTNLYLYGIGRIGQEGAGDWQYHLGDALGSVRQVTGCSGRNRTSVLENVLGHTMSDTITVLSSHQERQTVVSPYPNNLE